MSTIRLARFLARAGASSRRGAADLIGSGRVCVNGRPPGGPGDPVDPSADRVTLDGRPLALAPASWLAFNKPPRYLTSRRGSSRFATVFELLGEAPRALVPVGRLDVMSEGLLLLTTDGDLAARLMHPRWNVPRTYRVSVAGRPDAASRRSLSSGVPLPDESPVRPVRWEFVPDADGGTLEVTLTEGRSRVVRRMCTALGLEVHRLVRIAYGPVALGDLLSGRSRPLTGRELSSLYAEVALPPPQRWIRSDTEWT